MASPERQRLFGLIDSLEQDISELIRYHLLRVHSEEQLLTSDELSSARERQDDEAEDLISYLDLGPKVGVILRWKHDISESERPGLTRLATAMEGVYPIRNRVMHGRPLLPDDSEKCIAALTTIADSELNCPRLARTLQHLKADPSWLPPGALVRLPARVLNNLPDADYDDTGLIGRNRERAELMKLLTERRWPVISVIAAGGYGKTALALDVLHEIVGSPDCPFDLVAWVSLKTERLTSSGVVEIEAALRSVGDAIPTIGGLLDSSDASIDDLVQWLDGISTLLVLDNLETATSAEVVELIERMPQDVRFLFTSRVGIGQLEKRFELNPLGQSAAVELLRRLGQSRATYLGGAAQAQLAQLTNKVGFTPLALRWFAEGVAAGLEPAAVLEQRADLVRFCVENIFDGLPPDAQKVAWLLDGIGRPTPVPEIHSALPAWSIDRGRSAIQELVRRMFVVRTAVEGTLNERLDLTETLRDFLRYRTADPEWVAEISEAVASNDRERERLFRDREKGGLRPNIIHGNSEHIAAQTELRRSLALSAKGKIAEALQHVERADQLDPEFYENARVRAFILQRSRPAEATVEYTRALSLTADPTERAMVQYFFSAHLLKTESNAALARQLAQESHDALDLPETALQVANVLRMDGEYAKAIDILDSVMRQPSDDAFSVVGTTLSMNLRKRLAETLVHDRDSLVNPAQLLVDALMLADSAIGRGLRDGTMVREVVRCGSDLLNYLSQNPESPVDLLDLKSSMELLDRELPWARTGADTDWLKRHAERARPALASIGMELPESLASATNISSRHLGIIDWFDGTKGYGFVDSPSLGRTIFAHASDLADQSDLIHLVKGASFEFAVGTDQDGRDRAVELVACDDLDLVSRMIDRVCRVTHRDVGFALARDLATGATVFVGRHQLMESHDWDLVAIGTDLLLDVQIEDDGRFRSVTGSVRLT